MPKLKDVAKGSWAVHPVPLRLANAVQATPPGQPPTSESVHTTVGVRVLTVDETELAYQRAISRAREKGVETWDDKHPLCRLALMLHTLAMCCVDVDSDPRRPEPFFDGGVEEIATSIHIGQDNIVYLHERWENWQDECSFEQSKMSAEEVIATALAHAQEPANADSPLDRMRPGLRKIYTHTLAVLLSSSLGVKLRSGAPGDSSSSNSKSSTASEPAANESEADPR